MWFTIICIIAVLGLLVLAVLASIWMLADLDLFEKHQPQHTQLQITRRGKRLVVLAVLALVCTTVLIWPKPAPAQSVHGQGPRLIELMQVAPTCWHPPMLPGNLPACSINELDD